MRRSGGNSIDKPCGRRTHAKFEEMKKPLWQESDEDRDMHSQCITKRSAVHVKDFSLYLECSSKSRRD